MTKLISFLKPFWMVIVLVIGLLYGQAMADLALPDYMSDIVDVGIQQSGYTEPRLDIIKASDFQGLLMFADDSQKEQLESAYTYVEDSVAIEAAKTEYSNLDGPFYQLTETDETKLEALDLTVSKLLLTVASQMQQLDVDPSTMTDATILQAGVSAVKSYDEQLGVDVDTIQRNYILKTGGLMLLISLLSAAASITVGLLAARVAAGVGRNLRHDLFERVQSFTSREMNRFSTASLITRSTNDVTQIQTLLVIMIRMLFYAPIMGVGGVIRALDKSQSMSWIIALAVVLLLSVIIVIFSISMPKFKAIQRMVDNLNRIVRENLSGMMVIRAFNTQNFEEGRFDKANHELTSTNLFVNRIMVFLFPVMMLIMNGSTLLIVWVGAHQIEASAMQVGDMIAFMQYALQIIFSFLMLSMMFIMLPRASVSAQRISEVLDCEPSIVDVKEPVALNTSGKGRVEFKNVGFKYAGAEENSLSDISFTAEPGQTTAIIGSTGSGKTTLVNLIPRFYEATEGEIDIDGVPIKVMKQSDLRSVIGYVPQKAVLFSGTIESNLKFGQEKVDQSVIETAVEIAQATEIIEEKPEKYSAHVAQGGGNMSGGQKQRLSIARALVKQPKIYIFDDSFSALDFKTDAALRAALKEKTGESTVILVAQRISTIKNAEQILVLDQGRIVGKGTHTELMESCDTYREIALSQLSAEELA
jgi:ATP-binding cassette subfamily B protein